MDKRKVLVSIMAAVMALLLILPMISMIFSFAGATSTSDLQAQINNLKQDSKELSAQKKDLKSELKKIAADKTKALEQKSSLEQQMEVIGQEIANLNTQISSYDQLIADKQAEVAATKVQEQEQYTLFCARVRAMEEEGTVSYWSILLSADSFSDLLDRANFVSEIMEYDNALMDSLEATRLSLEQMQADLVAAQTEIKTAKTAQEAAKAELKEKQTKVKGLISQIADKADEAEKALNQLNAAAADMDAAIAKKEKEYRAKLAASHNTTKIDPGSGFQWPLPPEYVSITSFQGPRTHPITGRRHTHTGTDIGVPYGVSIYAAHGGIVLTSGYNSSYGNYVVVSRGDSVSTLYAHMSSRAVKEGDIVAQGQTLGYVGSTGASTGPHLHFELRENGVRRDALKYYTGIHWVNNTGFNY
ncbi:MAG: peptidoglycan DD-metalloendopeptidase family protein [Oscillospiraceae bacterium]